MSPFSIPVLAGATVVTAPALWGSLAGSMPIDTALTRFLVALAASWLLFSLVAGLIDVQPAPVQQTEPLPEQAADREDATRS